MLVSDWHTASDADRRTVRRLGTLVMAMAAFDLAFWLLFL